MPSVICRCLCVLVVVTMAVPAVIVAQPHPGTTDIDRAAARLEPQVIDWRRQIHENPELSNREFRTAEMVATHLKSLGMEVKTGVAKTGVVGVLRGGSPGPVVALRADMDALPVKELTGLPYASTDSTWYGGERVPVMHACGHDLHVAMLMGAAEILASQREHLRGTVKFLFQPAEEGTPPGERGGADLMVEQGVLESPQVDAVFGLHVRSKLDLGTVRYRSGPFMAAADGFRITVKGKQTHGATPWNGVDPIATAARIVNDVRAIGTRRPTRSPDAAVVSVGTFDAGVRNNIIPETATMTGTVRTLSPRTRSRVHRRIRTVATETAAEAGASVEVDVNRGYPATRNDTKLTEDLVPALKRAADTVEVAPPVMGAEDFSYFASSVPGLYVFVGGRPPDTRRAEAPSHHSPRFTVDERSLRYGVRAYAHVAMSYLHGVSTDEPSSAPVSYVDQSTRR